jgi:hypothetical protein
MLERYGGWLELSSHLHLPLTECLQRTTYRQYLVWEAWLREQWNTPDRHDYYLMQIALRVIQSRLKKGSSLSPDSQKIPFREVAAKIAVAPKQTVEQVTALSKAKWYGFLLLKGK